MRRLLKVVDGKGLYAYEERGITWEEWKPIHLPLDKTPAAPSLPAIAAGWHRPQPRPGQGARSRAVDDLLQKHGIQPRPRAR